MNKLQKKQLNRAREHAISKGGNCLSNEYIAGHEKLSWACSNGHIWEASFSNVVKTKGQIG